MFMPSIYAQHGTADGRSSPVQLRPSYNNNKKYRFWESFPSCVSGIVDVFFFVRSWLQGDFIWWAWYFILLNFNNMTQVSLLFLIDWLADENDDNRHYIRTATNTGQRIISVIKSAALIHTYMHAARARSGFGAVPARTSIRSFCIMTIHPPGSAQHTNQSIDNEYCSWDANNNVHFLLGEVCGEYMISYGAPTMQNIWCHTNMCIHDTWKNQWQTWACMRRASRLKTLFVGCCCFLFG